jgi:hypothetical protein
MASKIFREGIGFLPPPDLRLYVFLGSRSGAGINGPTFFQKESETSHAFICAIKTPV